MSILDSKRSTYGEKSRNSFINKRDFDKAKVGNRLVVDSIASAVAKIGGYSFWRTFG